MSEAQPVWPERGRPLPPALRALTVLGVLALSAVAPAPARATTPAIAHPVNDNVGAMTPAQVEAVAGRLVRHREQTGVQLAVLLVDTTAGQPIEDYAQGVFDAWGGGDAGDDRGALFILALADRRSRLHLGYGLEPLIPDGVARQLLDDLKPALRAGDTAGAVSGLVDAVIARTAHVVRGEAIAVPLPVRLGLGFFWLIVGVAVVLGAALGGAISQHFPKGRKGSRKRRRKGRRGAAETISASDGRPRVSPWAVAVGACALILGPLGLLLVSYHVGLVGPSLLAYGLGLGYGLVAAWAWRVSPALPISFVIVHAILLAPAGFVYSEGEALSAAVMFTFIQVLVWTTLPLALMFGFGMLDGGSSGGGGSSSYGSSGSSSSASWSSSSSSSSSSYSSSSSSSSSSYSGGGGSSGGGGASSGW